MPVPFLYCHERFLVKPIKAVKIWIWIILKRLYDRKLRLEVET